MRYHETSEEVILKGGWAWSGLVFFGLNGRALAAFFRSFYTTFSSCIWFEECALVSFFVRELRRVQCDRALCNLTPFSNSRDVYDAICN